MTIIGRSDPRRDARGALPCADGINVVRRPAVWAVLLFAGAISVGHAADAVDRRDAKGAAKATATAGRARAAAGASRVAATGSGAAKDPAKGARNESADGAASSSRKFSVTASRRGHEKTAPVAMQTRPVGDVAGRAASGDYLARPEVIDYIDDLVATERFERDALLRLFADVRYSATAARLMAPSSAPSGSTRGDWNAYRARFVEPVRLAAGFRFWDENSALLERAERDFGVPPEIVVGILGVETVYGRNTGSFRVIDALTTLAFDYPNKTRDRSTFFRGQLTDALLLSRDAGADLSSLRGSYAGAVGMPQFMPGSIRHFAVDYDGDGRIDLVGSPADVIGSVANFLAQHGWVRGQPTHLPLAGTSMLDANQAARVAAMVDAGSAPTFAYADLTAAGLVTTGTPVEPLALIDLPSGTDGAGRPIVTYIAGTQNFHAITRYNRSYFYAFSVIELGSTIRALRDVRP